MKHGGQTAGWPPGLVGARAAMVIAHPGHELRAHGWLEQARPPVFVLTDGSGGAGESRSSSGVAAPNDEARAEAVFMDAVGRRMQDYDRVRTEVEAYRNSAMMRIRNRLVKSP